MAEVAEKPIENQNEEIAPPTEKKILGTLAINSCGYQPITGQSRLFCWFVCHWSDFKWMIKHTAMSYQYIPNLA